MKTIFLTGATGYIGGSVSSKLIARGFRVRGLVRTVDKADLLQKLGIEPVIGDLDDAELLSAEARAADAVINTASADNAGAVKALIDGLRGSSKTLLHTSGSSVVGDDVRGARRTETLFDEDSTLLVAPEKQARRDIDLNVLRAAEHGVRSSVICPSLVYGVGSGLNQNSVQIPFLASNAREQGAVQIVGEGLNVWSNVHIEDLVDLYLLILEKAPGGSFYFAENGEASFLQLAEALRTRLALPSVQNLSPRLAAERWGIAKAYFSLGSNSRVRGKRARAELGWAPTHSSLVQWILNEMPSDIGVARA
jgi:nucleoside-diphosphate-sugar epimerase